MRAADVTVVGSGPNGLAAAVVAARAGLSVRVIEAEATLGGGMRSAESTLPGFLHDVCSAVHPLAVASPFFRAFELSQRVRLVTPSISFAHPLDDKPAVIAYSTLNATLRGLGDEASAWRRIFDGPVRASDGVIATAMSPLVSVPSHPFAAARLGIEALALGSRAGWHALPESVAALFAGVSAHSMLPQPSGGAAGAGVLLGTLAQSVGWPIPLGGSRAIAEALVADVIAHGGEVVTGQRIDNIDDVRRERGAVILDLGVRGFARVAAHRLPSRYLARLRSIRLGAGAAKVDFALSEPIPWADPRVAHAGTVHLGGTAAEVATLERRTWMGRHSESPFVLVAQPSRFDVSRAPEGQHAVWSYAHVPRGSTEDPVESVTRQIERFAPGFRDTVLAATGVSAARLGEHNENCSGGDISGGAPTLRQLVQRPTVSPTPWRTPLAGVYLCSAATAPGPGVHGMGGWHAARLALRDRFGIAELPELGISARIG